MLSPTLLDLVNATPEVRAEALPFLRTMFVFSIGHADVLHARRRAARRPATRARRCGSGIADHGAERRAQRHPDPRRWADPRVRHAAARRSARSIASMLVSASAIWLMFAGGSSCSFRAAMSLPAGLDDHPVALPVRAAGRHPGRGDEHRAACCCCASSARCEHSAEAQAAYAVGYAELFSLITWTSVGLMGAAAAVAGQNLGAGQPDRSAPRACTSRRASAWAWPRRSARSSCSIPDHLLGIFGLNDPIVVSLGTQLLRYLSVSGLFITVALTYTGGLQGTG